MHTSTPLGALLTSPDNTIKRNAYSILKRLTNCPHERYEYQNNGNNGLQVKKCTVCGILKPAGMR